MTPSEKKRALAVLDANRLRELVDELAVDVASRKHREHLIDALADGRRLDFAELLAKVQRDELKAMCRALGLPDDGREKMLLITRLLAPPPTTGTPADPRPAPTTPATTGDQRGPWALGVLQLLKRDELQEAVERFDVDVHDRRSVEQLVAALVKAKVPVAHVVEPLPRVRLKEMCRVLGLDDSGREKSLLIGRLSRETPRPTESEHDLTDVHEPEALPTGIGGLQSLLGTSLEIEEARSYWPARARLKVAEAVLPVDIYARVIGPTGRNPVERRLQNPAAGTPIVALAGRPCLLLGLWLEQGPERAVLVAFDAYRRTNRSTRFSLFMSLPFLEEAADTGFVTHVTASGETLYAFRPDSLARYLDAFAANATWGANDPGPWAKPARTNQKRSAPPLAPVGLDSVEIRPKAGMFAAFSRLNYKPWFALAELVDNAVQSFVANRARLVAAGSEGPLVVDITIDDDEISVADRACGIALADFPRAFSPATPPSDASGLSEFGLGMKAAACWFADEWSVRTSPLGESTERTIRFDVPQITREGLNDLPIETRETRTDDHYTVLTMRRLRVRPKGSTLIKVKEHLASIYRLLIADGTLRVRVTAFGKLEELAYQTPELLLAPFYATPEGPTILWRRDISIDLGDRKVTGWAGLMSAGKHSRAGFSVFRRGRLIEGSVGEAYRPRAVFGAHNSFASQRLVGQLYVDGFDVTHTKDGIQWGDYEEDVAYELRMQLSTEELPMLEQAEGYRARKYASLLPPDFGEKAIASTAAAASRLDIQTSAALDDEEDAESEPTAAEPSSEPLADRILHERSFRMVVNGIKPWDVRLELVRDKGAAWLTCATELQDEQELLKIKVNLDHDFSIEHLNNNERAVEPILRLAVALSIGELQARLQGVKSSGAIRKHANELLRLGLSSAPIGTTTGGRS